ncbi:MAG: hypothetical protein Q9207_004427 [Kuettlingeria erythrocarpa]
MFSERRATPDDLLPNGSTLLHYSDAAEGLDSKQIVASRNHIDVVALLLQEGAKVNATNDFGETPLHSAIAFARDYNICRLLVQSGADLQNKNAEGKSPLHTFSNVAIQQLLRCHSDHLDLSASDHGGMSLLHYLAWSSKTSSDEFRRYHRQSHLSLLNVNAEGQSVLHFAAQRGNLAIMQYIIQADGIFKMLADLQDARGRTALHYAVENKRGAEAVAMLLSHGADIRTRDHHGRSVLHHAARPGRLTVVESLVKALSRNMVDELHVSDIWAAAHEIKTGVRISLDWPLNKPAPPGNGREPLKHEIRRRGHVGRVVNDDVVEFNTQCSSQWDGLRHYGYLKERKYYNNIDPKQIASSSVLGIDAIASAGGIVGRGVLLDYGRFAYNHQIPLCPFTSSPIRLSHLQQHISEQNITVSPGDILFIRSGFTAAYDALSPTEQEALAARETPEFMGIEATPQVAEWIWEQGCAAVAGDAVGWEVLPLGKKVNDDDEAEKVE